MVPKLVAIFQVFQRFCARLFLDIYCHCVLGEKTNQMPHLLRLHLVYLSMIYIVCIVFNSLKLGLYQVWDSVNMGLQI